MRAVANLDKSKIKFSFSSAATSYDHLAELQRRVGRELLKRFPLERWDGVLLDLGCGTGFLTRLLNETAGGRHLIALDLALPMLKTSRTKYPAMGVQYLCGDAEQLPFAEHSICQIYSNLALQWVHDLAATFAGFKRVLKPGGRLIFATFGPMTLCELKEAWATVDRYTHVNDFYSAAEIEGFLSEAGFNDVGAETVIYRCAYPTVLDLMRELKGIGAHNVNHGRNPNPTTKAQLQGMTARYQEQMAGQAILASYEIIFVEARV